MLKAMGKIVTQLSHLIVDYFCFILIIISMKMKNMTKRELIESIKKAEGLINNKNWIKHQSKFWIGVYVVHLAKLRQELRSRK